MKQRGAGGAGHLFLLCHLLLALSLLALLVPTGVAYGACVCSSGRMTNWFPGTAPISIDGGTGDWNNVIADPHNNICDGSPASPILDLDAPVQSTGRDLEQFTYTYDTDYVYALTKRYASSTNTDNFIYYADTNNNGLMQTGESVIVVGWQGNNRDVSVYLGTYLSYYPGGDPMVCIPGSTAGQSCTTGYADGYHLPGTIANLPSAGHPTYQGNWGSSTGTEMEWYVSWADLGVTPGTAFSFHVSSTNSQPGSGSFPAQTDDNMGGCGGGGGTTQYAGVSLTPDQTISLTASLTYTASHILTNTGNGDDNFTLSYAVSGSNSPTPAVTYYYNGQPFTDTSTLGAGFAIAPGASITFTAQYSFGSSPANKNYNVTTTAASKFNSSTTAEVVDSLVSQKAIVLHKETNSGSYGSFSFGSGTNGLPASLTLTTSVGNNPVASTAYIISNPGKPSSITETVASGWRFVSAACSYAPSGNPVTDVSVTNNQAASPPTAVLTINSFAFAASDTIVNCTFSNEKLPTVVVSKLMGGARVSDADQFTVQLKYGATVLGSASAGTGQVVTAGTGTVSYAAGATGVAYTLDEVKSAGPTPANVYAAAVTCTNNGVALATPNALGQSFTPLIGDNYLCWITNTPPGLTVRKRSIGGTGAFSFAGANGVAASFTLDTAAANPQAQGFVLSAINTQTAVTETVPAGWTLTGSCLDGAGNPVPGTTLANGTLTVPAAAIVAGAKLVCTFVNTLKPDLLLVKTSDRTNADPGQVVTYTIQMANRAGAATGVVLTDLLSPHTAFGVDSFGAGVAFQFVDGAAAAASGLAPGTPSYSRDSGATWSYLPSPAFDGNVTNWQLPMVGTMNGWAGAPNPYPSFTLTYKVMTR